MPVVNGPLDAAVAALKAQPYPWFVPQYSIRLTDATVYASLVSTYGFGTPAIIGLSPDAAATLTGVAIVSDASYGAQQIRPEIYVHPSALNVLGVAITTAQSGGTILVPYTNAFGTYDRVIWQWQCDVELFPIAVADPTVTGSYEQQVVTWIGDGTANRLIATTFSLASGVVAIWGAGGTDGVFADQVNFFRHNQSTLGVGAMLGTQMIGVNSDPVVAQGIVAFESGGFRVTVGAVVSGFANTAGIHYSAIVMRDTTSDNHYLRCGSYIGTAGGTLTFTVTQGSGAVTHAGGTAYQQWSGRTLKDTTHGNKIYIFTYSSPTTGSISPVYADIPTNPTTLTFVTVGQTIGVSGKSSDLTHVWVWRNGLVYKSTDVPGSYSVELVSGANLSVPLDSMVTGLATGGFLIADTTVGAQHSVNTFTQQYDYLALSIDATFSAAHLFASVTGSGAGAPPTTTGSFGFTPTLAFARQGNLAGATAGGIFRASFDTGTNSQLVFDATPSATGITAIGTNTLSLGVAAAIAGQPYYAWGFLTGSFAVPAPPAGAAYVAGLVVPPGSYVPDGGLLIGSGLGTGRTGPCGCPE